MEGLNKYENNSGNWKFRKFRGSGYKSPVIEYMVHLYKDRVEDLLFYISTVIETSSPTHLRYSPLLSHLCLSIKRFAIGEISYQQVESIYLDNEGLHGLMQIDNLFNYEKIKILSQSEFHRKYPKSTLEDFDKYESEQKKYAKEHETKVLLYEKEYIIANLSDAFWWCGEHEAERLIDCHNKGVSPYPSFIFV
jgi:hypothetical protein